eukprot:TRINITY_DN10774_c0_g1_i2.p1 TRINITY_DN10774_c0_g1~~TRINITY_DN10774_c0_g1_i2.p1  ORF type:complete len:212 (-),score=22.21 TRINITY_DN10774_c0_g1_i2:233-868(-)
MMEQVKTKLMELTSIFKLPGQNKFRALSKEDESNRLVSIASSQKQQHQQQLYSSDRLKPLHQLWYVEDNMTLVPMVCYKSKDAPLTSIVLSKNDGEQLWCVPQTKSLSLRRSAPIEGKLCTPIAGGMAWKINLGDRPKRRFFRKLVVTGTTMAVGAGILKGVQYASTNEAIQSQIKKLKTHFQRENDDADVQRLELDDSNHDPFHPGVQEM